MSSDKRSYQLKARAQRQQETRQRIVAATAELHEEIGPARTTVAEVARRAGVNRLTVYNHFPDERELFAACQRHFLTRHPPPDLSRALALTNPHERARAALRTLYRSYEARASMTAKVLRDRELVPALDELLARTVDSQQAQLADTLASSFRTRGARARQLRALTALAIDFQTWQRLTAHHLNSHAAADLMAQLISRTATPA